MELDSSTANYPSQNGSNNVKDDVFHDRDTSTDTSLHIDRQKIQTSNLNTEFEGTALQELEELGVESFQASDLEKSVIRQIDEQLEHQAAYKSNRELQKLKNTKNEFSNQLSRLKSQCKRLSKLDQNDNEVKQLYAECFASYKQKKAEIKQIEENIQKIVSQIDSKFNQEKNNRVIDENDNHLMDEFDIGMRMTTRKEQNDQFLKSQNDAKDPSKSSESNTKVMKRKREVDEIDFESNKKSKHSENESFYSSASERQPAPATHETNKIQQTKKRQEREEEDDDDQMDKDEDSVDEILNQFASSRNENERDLDTESVNPEVDNNEKIDVQDQKLQHSVLGDKNDEIEFDYISRIEEWIKEHPQDPRSKKIIRLKNIASQETEDTESGNKNRKKSKSSKTNNSSIDNQNQTDDKQQNVNQDNIRDMKSKIDPNEPISVLSPKQVIKLDEGYEISKTLYKKLFEHQKVAVRWLWELHKQEAGGILGDEMGLGKTLEIVSFLSGLATSGLLSAPILIVCPTTVVQHWIREFHWWAPEFRVFTYRGSSSKNNNNNNNNRNSIRQVIRKCQACFDSKNGFTHLRDQYLQSALKTLKPDAHHNGIDIDDNWKESRFGEDVKNDEESEIVDIVDIDKVFDEIFDEKPKNNSNTVKSSSSSMKNGSEEVDEEEMEKINNVDGKTPVVLIMSYETLRMNIGDISRRKWDYAIMDEGHKLRNPEAGVTIASKQIPTLHRLILTGTPIQNNLVELWSLFDFCYPGKLGTLETFEKQFSWPIQRGGYATASPMEVRVAYKCAVILRDLVNPYLLRRSKDQVNIQLPKKAEQILFCKLTEKQKTAYKRFLASTDATAVYEGLKNMLYGVDILRKICNHVFLLDHDHGKQAILDSKQLSQLTEGSAKLKVLNHVLSTWKQQGHRVLVFAQTTQMLDMIEAFVHKAGYCYLRMDGSTPASKRQALVDRFNDASSIQNKNKNGDDDEDEDEEDDVEVVPKVVPKVVPGENQTQNVDDNVQSKNTAKNIRSVEIDDNVPFVFLLTTRVGGLGINLTSANRVVVFDPDWNPMTDMQAKERAYRIGQSKSVIVYRLVTSGTIEEKIYHRQVFKQFLTQKILKDPKQTRSFFKSSDIRDLFKLQDRSTGTHTEDLLSQVPVQKSMNSDSESDSFSENESQTNTNSKTKKKKNKKKKDGDSWLLDGLMGQGISGKVDHDQVIDSATGHRGKTKTLESYIDYEAENLAAQAVANLRASRAAAIALSSASTVKASKLPKFGTISSYKPTAKKASIMAASPVISDAIGSKTALSKTQSPHSGTSLISSLKEHSVHPNIETQGYLIQLKEFLNSSGGGASSDQIASFFKNKVKQTQLHVFRSLLRQITDFDPNTKYWTLKPWAGGPMGSSNMEV